MVNKDEYIWWNIRYLMVWSKLYVRWCSEEIAPNKANPGFYSGTFRRREVGGRNFPQTSASNPPISFDQVRCWPIHRLKPDNIVKSILDQNPRRSSGGLKGAGKDPTSTMSGDLAFALYPTKNKDMWTQNISYTPTDYWTYNPHAKFPRSILVRNVRHAGFSRDILATSWWHLLRGCLCGI